MPENKDSILQADLMEVFRIAIDAQQKADRSLGHHRTTEKVVKWKAKLESLRANNLEIKYPESK